MDIRDFLQKKYRYAVIGSVYNPEKYGFKVMLDLHNAGLSVVGLHPQAGQLQGVKIFSSLSDIPDLIDVLVFVVRPEIGLTVLDEAKKLGIEKVWFQPGAENTAIQKKVQELGMNGVTDGSCIMVARRTLGIHG